MQTPEVFASESAAVSCFLSAAYVETGKLTVTLSEIDEVKAQEVVNLTPKKRTLFGTLLASLLRSIWTVLTVHVQKEPTVMTGACEAVPEDITEPVQEESQKPETEQAVPREEESSTEPVAVDEELNRIVGIFKLAREQGYTQAEYDRLGECREQYREVEAKISALNAMAAAEMPDFDWEIREAQETIGGIKRTMTNVIAYISKRAELTFSQLKMNRVEISLYDVVKSTGEAKDTFKFTYSGRRYDRLSLSEKVRAGMEVSELVKRLTGRNYPVFVDNMESVDDLANVRPTGQIIMAKCVSNAPLQVRPIKPIACVEQRAA